MKKNQKILSEEKTLCGFTTEVGDSHYLIDIYFHRNINFKEAAAGVMINLEKARCDLYPRNDIPSERYTAINGDTLLNYVKKIDSLKDSPKDIVAIYIKDVFGPENFFIKVKFDGETFRRETNYPGNAPTMKLTDEKKSMTKAVAATID